MEQCTENSERLVLLKSVMERFNISEGEATTGLFKYGFHKSRKFHEWTTVDFKRSLSVAQAVEVDLDK